MKKIITTQEAPAAIGPYNQAVEINGLVFISGQIPLVPGESKLVEGGIKEQAHQVLVNLEAVLKASGCNLENVVKTTCFLQSLEDFAAMNEVYAQFFKENQPARAAVEVSRLPKDAMIEIEAIAVK